MRSAAACCWLLLTILGWSPLRRLGVSLLAQLTPIPIWAMNFALVFALALGNDYARWSSGEAKVVGSSLD